MCSKRYINDGVDVAVPDDLAKRKGAALDERGDREIIDVANYRLFRKGEHLFKEGNRGSEAYIVKTGLVSVTVKGTGAGKTVGHVKPGEVVGEMAVISDMPRMATATAEEETLCIALSRHAVRLMIARTDLETRTLINFLIVQVQAHAMGEKIDRDQLERNHRILEILMTSSEQLKKLDKMEPFFALLCRSLMDRAKAALSQTKSA